MNPAYLVWTDMDGVTHWVGRGFRPGTCPVLDAKLGATGIRPDEWGDYPAITTCAFCIGSRISLY